MSPKRKRSNSSPFAAALDTTNTLDDERQSAQEDSPRTKVVERFQRLDIESTPSPTPAPTEYAPRQQHTRKRIRRDGNNSDNQHIQAYRSAAPRGIGISGIPETPPAFEPTARFQFEEIGETPGAYSSRFPSSPPISPNRPGVHSHKLSSSGPARPVSPPPPTPITSPQSSSDDEDGSKGAVTPLALEAALEEETKERIEVEGVTAALTWQESEITGHEIDRTGGDDDGEGINGIGFRPTAAIAHARSARRKQQVNEWRAREAREARQRRFEKRKASGGSVGKGEMVNQKRVVRFADG